VSVDSDAAFAAAPAAAPDRSATGADGVERARPARRRTRWLDPRRDIPVWAYRALGVGGFAGCLLLWAWLSHKELIDPVFLPTPEAVWSAGRTSLSDANLWLDIKASFLRVTAGFLLAAAMGIPIGVAIGGFKVWEGLLQPLTDFVRYIPVPALIPICMVIFGIEERSKIALIWAGTFFQLVLMVADEIRRVPYEMLQISYTLGAGRWQVVRRVLWRAAKPGIFDALRLCNGWAWTYLVIAELVAANEGLGFRILKFSRFLQTPRIWVYLVILGVIGLALDLGFRVVNRRLFFWANTRAT
jgi:NitT/TauT family transport system permease protein